MAPARKIEAVELSSALAGNEGVDPNHASRIRIHTLLDQNASLVQQTQFADAKSGGLVTLVGLLALKGPMPVTSFVLQDILSVTSTAITGLAILFCLLSVFPRYPGKRIRKHLSDVDRFSWPSLTAPDFDADVYARYMQTAEVSQIVYSIARSNSAVAQILLRKFQMLRIAFVMAIALFGLLFLRHSGMV